MDTIRDGRTPRTTGTQDPTVILEYPVGRDAVDTSVFRCLSGEELFLNTLISGGKGKGKTAGVIKPFLRWMITHPQHCGGLIYDVKGDLAPYALQWARRVGRENDVVVVGPDYDTPVQLMPRGMPAETIASGIVTAAATIAGGTDPREAFWVQSAEELIKFLVILIRMLNDADHHCAISPAQIRELVGQEEKLMVMVNTLDVREEEGRYRTVEDRHHLGFLRRYWTASMHMDSRVRTSIEAEVIRFLKDFSGYRLARAFGAPAQGTDVLDVRDIPNKGIIVCLQMQQAIWGEVARFIGLLLKSQFYNVVMQRLTMPGYDRDRPVFFVCDEYQNYLTVGGKVGADDQFAALSRQAKAGMVCATQELGALYGVARRSDEVSNLLQNFQNQILLQQTITPKLDTLLKGRGMRGYECLPKLKTCEAILHTDTDPTPRVVHLGPYFGTWNWRRDEDKAVVERLAKRKHEVFAGVRTTIGGAR